MPVGDQDPALVSDQNGKFFFYGALDAESMKVITEAHPKDRT
jgi:hypothetical protein